MVFSGKVLRQVRAVALGGFVAAALLACGGGTSQNEAYKPERVVAMGDEHSLVTAGGLKYGVNGLSATAAVDCAANPLWVQAVLSSYPGYVFAECNPTNELSPQGVMRAALGARVADLKTQVDAQVAAGGFATKTLVTVLVGMHDVLDLYADFPRRPESELIAEARVRGEQLAAQVNRMVDLGARVIISTVPDMGLSPYGLAQKAAITDTDRSALLSRLTAALNGRMRVTVINDGRFIGLVLADEMVQAMSKSPISFGLVEAGKPVCNVALPNCNTNTLVASGNAATYLWADDIHMAPGGHTQLGALAQQRALNNPF
jgi:outer membrane lipase/esterase